MARQQTPVLIVGAGLVGLTAAIALHQRGIASIVVERHSGTSVQPKARRFNFRTMEVFRSLGIAEPVYRAAAGLTDYQVMRAGHTLVDSEPLTPLQDLYHDDLAGTTPEQSCLVAQDILEPVLLDLARERGADIRFNTRLTALTQDGAGVTATVHAPPGEHTIRADHLIGADGAHSTVRQLLGIRRAGRGLGRNTTVYFRADLGELVRGREFNLCQIEHPDAPGAFASLDGRYRWLFMTGDRLPVPGNGGPLSAADAARWAGVVTTALGVSGVDITVTSVQSWEPAMRVADRFAAGRIFLAGDAAHVMPPWAAQGANTGIQDIPNLVWKLAAVRAGAAHPDLLETYHTERHAAGWYAADQSARRSGGLRQSHTDAGLDHPFALIAGYQYPAGAFLPDGSDPQPMDRIELSGRPGTRVPHRQLDPTTSTLDLVGPGFALLTGPAGIPWAGTGLDLPVHHLDAGWPARVGIGPGGALLVRPDGIVAWRSAGPVPEPEAALHDVFDRLLRTAERDRAT